MKYSLIFAFQINPFDPTVLAKAAHFFSHPSSGGNAEEALDLYARMYHIDIPLIPTIYVLMLFSSTHSYIRLHNLI